MGERYLEGLALWQAEDVLPYQKHLVGGQKRTGNAPSLVGQDVPGLPKGALATAPALSKPQNEARHQSASTPEPLRDPSLECWHL